MLSYKGQYTGRFTLERRDATRLVADFPVTFLRACLRQVRENVARIWTMAHITVNLN